MPHTRSAKKSLRKSEKRRLLNRAAKKAIRVQIKEIHALVKEGSLDRLKQAYNLAAKKLDKAAARNVIHPNFASRKKSQLSKLLQSRAGSAQDNAG
jgi:small subunit ribosomal protein S20